MSLNSMTQLSKEMHDLVKSIGETRSKQEEDKIILAEQAKLKLTIKDASLSMKKQKENLIRAMYIEMLGHDASFAHFNAVQMAQSKSLQMKRLGYLTCCLFLNESSELLILLVANLQKDLSSKNVHEIVIALSALAKLMNKTILQGVLEQVLKLLIHHTDLVRKKAVSVMQRIHQLQPDSIPDYDDRMRRAICDVEPSVMGATLNLYLESAREEPTKHKDQVNSFVMILKQVIEHKLPRDFDYARIPAPWIQIKILQLLAILGKKDQKVSEQIYEIVGSALRRSDDAGSKIGFAVTYQCVKTIAAIYPYQSLLKEAVAAVSRFLTAESNNLKYLGINALISIVQVNPSCVLDHQLTIMDCLESTDDTLKLETMELLYKMTNLENVQPIVDRLILFLKSTADPIFRKNLVSKITSLADRHSPSYEWYLRTMNLVFEHGSEQISNEILNTFLRTLADNFATVGTEFGSYLIDQYLVIIKKSNLSDVTYQLISWVFGEIGAATYGNNEEILRNLVECLLECITTSFEDKNTRGWVLNALAKLSSCSAFSMSEEVAECLEFYADSNSTEVSTRAVEYKILSKYNAALRQSTLIKVDPSLRFLDAFVEKSVRNGAPRYDQSKLVSSVLQASTSKSETLKFEAYSQSTLGRVNQNKAFENIDALPVLSKNPWEKDGFNEQIVAPSTSSAFKAAESVSSSDYKQPNRVGGDPFTSSSSSSRSNTTTTTTSMQSQSSSSSTSSQWQPQPQQPVKPRAIPEDPKKKQMELMAKSFFNPIAVSSSTAQQNAKPAVASYSIPSANATITFTQQQQQQSTPNMPTYSQPVQPKKPTTNLLDDDDDDTNELNGSAASSVSQQFMPLIISVEQYETYWESLKNEIQRDVKSAQIRSEVSFRNMLSALGIGVIEVQENELICAAKQKQSQGVLLFYGTYTPQGQLSITIKSNSMQDIDSVFQTVLARYL